jgi:hypothetical protein
MDTTETNQQEKHLWKTAKKRAGFKWTLACYIIVNIFMVGVWAMGNREHFWPIWSILGWGLGVVMLYLDAYHSTGIFSTKKEYEKLKKQAD